jgi:hypothetical protein
VTADKHVNVFRPDTENKTGFLNVSEKIKNDGIHVTFRNKPEKYSEHLISEKAEKSDY